MSEDLGEYYRGCISRLESQLESARKTSEYWKAEHLAGNLRIQELEKEIVSLKTQLDAANLGWA